MNNRPDTGPMAFGEDWTGIFLRGDEACYFAFQLGIILEMNLDIEPIAKKYIEGLQKVLSACNEKDGNFNKKDIQLLKPWKECIK